jgi:D-serine deaminase-like pyridoxal phosphate-dependent protein
MSNPLYNRYKNATLGLEMPFLLLDKLLFDKNIEAIIHRAKGRPIRIASKSIRCNALIKSLLDQHKEFIGVMSYSALETLFLLENEIDNILLGYPITNKEHIKLLCNKIARGARITFMVDCIEHIRLIQEQAKLYDIKAPICIDIDMSSKFPFIYFGVYRSSVKGVDDLKHLINQISNFDNISIEGIMGYEAQIAGLGDNIAGAGLMNSIIRFLKKKSIKEIAQRRKACIDFLQAKGFELKIINGGGTGSIESTFDESYINEITVGSGFFSSHLFDNYKNFKHESALMYAIECTRKPTDNIITCTGGGYVASGAVGLNKQAIPHLPQGLTLLKDEGTGEVQTPFDISECVENLQLGDPIFMRHSKAGEVCERFNKIHILVDEKNILSVNTYRGNGKCFM